MGLTRASESRVCTRWFVPLRRQPTNVIVTARLLRLVYVELSHDPRSGFGAVLGTQATFAAAAADAPIAADACMLGATLYFAATGGRPLRPLCGDRRAPIDAESCRTARDPLESV